MASDASDADPILQAAIARFALDGDAATLRGIAEDAGVSAALLVKRYGSKSGLREACDAEILARIVEIKEQNVRDAAQHSFLSHAPGDQEQALLIRYILQSVRGGGTTARAFLEHMVEDAERYIALAVERGIARPSRDERARARFLTISGLGAVLLSTMLADGSGREDPAALLDRMHHEITPPMLELYTQGFFIDGSILEEYLLYISDPPQGRPEPAPEP